MPARSVSAATSSSWKPSARGRTRDSSSTSDASMSGMGSGTRLGGSITCATARRIVPEAEQLVRSIRRGGTLRLPAAWPFGLTLSCVETTANPASRLCRVRSPGEVPPCMTWPSVSSYALSDGREGIGPTVEACSSMCGASTCGIRRGRRPDTKPATPADCTSEGAGATPAAHLQQACNVTPASPPFAATTSSLARLGPGLTRFPARMDAASGSQPAHGEERPGAAHGLIVAIRREVHPDRIVVGERTLFLREGQDCGTHSGQTWESSTRCGRTGAAKWKGSRSYGPHGSPRNGSAQDVPGRGE